jgi:hypothetical protein
MTMHNAAAVPITSADPHREVVPHSYVVWHKPQHCKTCGTTHSHSELYAKTHIRSQLGIGKYITNLRPLDTPKYNLPVEIIQAPPTEVAFCAECYDRVDLKALPSPPASVPRYPSVIGFGGHDAPKKPDDRRGREHRSVTTDDLAL